MRRRRRKKPRPVDYLLFYKSFRAAGLPSPLVEHRFAAPDRRWAIDYAWPDHDPPLAVEIEGGIYTRQAHGSISGIKRDIEKYNALSLHGYHLLRFTPEEMMSGEALSTIQEWFRQRESERG